MRQHRPAALDTPRTTQAVSSIRDERRQNELVGPAVTRRLPVTLGRDGESYIKDDRQEAAGYRAADSMLMVGMALSQVEHELSVDAAAAAVYTWAPLDMRRVGRSPLNEWWHPDVLRP